MVQQRSASGPILERNRRNGFLRGAVLWVDAVLKRRLGIQAFTRNPDCLLRLSMTRSGADVTLSDGTRIVRDESVGEIHFWNERLPQTPPSGPDLAWALAFQRLLRHSLVDLAAFVETDPRFRGVRAFRGTIFLDRCSWLARTVRPVQRFGLELRVPARRGGPRQAFVDFWEEVYSGVLCWAFNPCGTRSRRLRSATRRQFWISRNTLLALHGNGAERPDGADLRGWRNLSDSELPSQDPPGIGSSPVVRPASVPNEVHEGARMTGWRR